MKQGIPITREYDLTRVNLIRSMLRSRWPQFILRLMALAGFIFAILALLMLLLEIWLVKIIEKGGEN
jgi:hypothetical protein